MIEIITDPQFIVNTAAGLVFIILGAILTKKEKKWGVYISLLGVIAIVVNIIRVLVTM